MSGIIDTVGSKSGIVGSDVYPAGHVIRVSQTHLGSNVYSTGAAVDVMSATIQTDSTSDWILAYFQGSVQLYGNSVTTTMYGDCFLYDVTNSNAQVGYCQIYNSGTGNSSQANVITGGSISTRFHPASATGSYEIKLTIDQDGGRLGVKGDATGSSSLTLWYIKG